MTDTADTSTTPPPIAGHYLLVIPIPVYCNGDGKRYVDYVLSWGPMILGHADEDVLAAVIDKARAGLSFGAPTEIETHLAREIIKLVPSMELVRFVSSGTEATMSAIRLARGFTGREMILKFDGCYHGHVDSLMVKAGSGVVTQGLADSAGVPAQVAADTLVIPLGDSAALEQAFREHGRELAAAIIEPVPANNGLLLQSRDYLLKLRELTRTHGTVLIFDEVITGFRFGYHGYDKVVGIEARGFILGGAVATSLGAGFVPYAPPFSDDDQRAVTLALWRVADPGNVGTLVRTVRGRVILRDAPATPLSRRAVVASAVSAGVVTAPP